MLLPITSFSPRKAAAAAVTALTLVSIAVPQQAAAWGEREQNALAGFIAGIAVQKYVLSPPKKNRPTVVVPRQPVYAPVPQQPTYTSIYSTPSALAFNSYSINERKRIQSTLTSYGYYHSSIDGVFGPGTYAAVNSYAAATGKSSLLTTSSGAYTLYDGLLF
jgi:hypothetical protein